MADRHILVVEDDPDLLTLLVEVLQEQGYRVSAASRRTTARAALRRGRIDLIVADSVLRGGNGDDIAAAAGRQGVPIIVMSGEPDRITALRTGTTPFLEKPFHAAALVELVAKLLP